MSLGIIDIRNICRRKKCHWNKCHLGINVVQSHCTHVHTDRCSCQQHYDAFPELIVSQYTKNEKNQ